jgi:hypothetical protein
MRRSLEKGLSLWAFDTKYGARSVHKTMSNHNSHRKLSAQGSGGTLGTEDLIGFPPAVAILEGVSRADLERAPREQDLGA